MLVEVAVEERQHPLAVRRVVGGVDVEDQVARRLHASADKQLDQVVVTCVAATSRKARSAS